MRWSVKVLVCVLFVTMVVPAFAQFTDMAAFQELGGAKEFAHRRDLLSAELKTGYVLLFANTEEPQANHYREDNDFYYFTGVADAGAVVLIDVEKKSAVLFEPEQSERMRRYIEPNVLSFSEAARTGLGFKSVLPIGMLYPVLNGLLGTRGEQDVWMRLGFPDKVDGARMEAGTDAAAEYEHPFGLSLTRDRERVQRLRERWPAARLRDFTPTVDRMRNIKTATEIEVLRRNGKLSAEGIRKAIAHARPGMFEYQVEAVASEVFREMGAQGIAYTAIVGSGPNSNVWHYSSNRRKMQAGEVVVFDYAADLDQMTMDITRTFPVGGKFTNEQAKWYGVDLEAQKAMIGALKPGATYEQVGDIGKAIYERNGIGNQWRGFTAVGHFVGLGVHDVMSPVGPVKAGQVVTVEPIIEFPEKHIHFRIEDTVLVTENGPEILTSGVPKEMVEIEKLTGSESR